KVRTSTGKVHSEVHATGRSCRSTTIAWRNRPCDAKARSTVVRNRGSMKTVGATAWTFAQSAAGRSAVRSTRRTRYCTRSAPDNGRERTSGGGSTSGDTLAGVLSGTVCVRGSHQAGRGAVLVDVGEREAVLVRHRHRAPDTRHGHGSDRPVRRKPLEAHQQGLGHAGVHMAARERNP